MAVSTVAVDTLRMTATLTRLLRFVDQSLRSRVDESVGLTELGVLGTIQRGIELPSAIARAMRVDPARVTRVVDLLVRRGYLRRGVDTVDRRRCPLSLTARGEKCLERGRRTVTEVMESVLGRLPKDQQAGLVTTLDLLQTVLEDLK
jgi:DNA-binding MarR family transcriptional regulator